MGKTTIDITSMLFDLFKQRFAPCNEAEATDHLTSDEIIHMFEGVSQPTRKDLNVLLINHGYQLALHEGRFGFWVKELH